MVSLTSCKTSCKQNESWQEIIGGSSEHRCTSRSSLYLIQHRLHSTLIWATSFTVVSQLFKTNRRYLIVANCYAIRENSRSDWRQLEASRIHGGCWRHHASMLELQHQDTGSDYHKAYNYPMAWRWQVCVYLYAKTRATGLCFIDDVRNLVNQMPDNYRAIGQNEWQLLAYLPLHIYNGTFPF